MHPCRRDGLACPLYVLPQGLHGAPKERLARIDEAVPDGDSLLCAASARESFFPRAGAARPRSSTLRHALRHAQARQAPDGREREVRVREDVESAVRLSRAAAAAAVGITRRDS